MRNDASARQDRDFDRERTMHRTPRLLLKALIAVVACFSAIAPAAQAQFEILNPGAEVKLDGKFTRQAGAHADLTTELDFTPGESVKNVRVILPPGLLGDPTAFPTCTNAQLFELTAGGNPNCPIGSQIGTAAVKQGFGQPFKLPVFNMAHGPELPGLFAFNYSTVLVSFVPRVVPQSVPGGYGVQVTAPAISQAQVVLGSKVIFWGAPADPTHDAERYDPHKKGFEQADWGASSPANNLPFMTNPTACTEQPLVTRMEADAWSQQGVFAKASFDREADGTPFLFDRCELVPFEPEVEVRAGTHRAASTSGLDLKITVPQSNAPHGLATAHVKRVVVAFPQGLTVSPSAVAGLGACSEAEIGLGDNNPPTCPDSSKIGNVAIKTPVLEQTLEGDVYMARQTENPFRSIFAIYMVVRGPGFYLKLPGELNIDKQTGRLRTVFDNNPQLPFEELSLDFRGGPTAPLTTPDVCGTYTTRSEITSWASAEPVIVNSPTLIDENCDGGGSFKPSLQAGVANPVAGAKSPLTIRIKRQDGEQNISRFDVTLPEGELASLKGLDVCSDAAAPSGNCPKGSQVGISTTAIGTGAFPLFVPQPGKDPTALYLAGPYKGAPYSLIAKVPAQSGPFDFGNIVVRTAINLNPVTAQVIAESNPLPQILEGVPIQYRDVRIEVQKPDFTINPTSCQQRFVKTKIYSTQGAVATPSVPTKVGDCGALNFGPKLKFKVSGGTNRGDFQALKATLTTGKKEANISRVAVTLPHSEFLEQSHIGTVCTRVQFAAKKCPAASVYGFARAVTPLLDKPLEGPVYLRSSNHSLPDMVAQLNGQFDIELAGRIDSVNERIRNTFELVPDAPVTKFTLTLQGGKKSLLVNSRNLCAATSRADVKMVGQNGKRHNERPVVKNSCSKGELRKARTKARAR